MEPDPGPEENAGYALCFVANIGDLHVSLESRDEALAKFDVVPLSIVN